MILFLLWMVGCKCPDAIEFSGLVFDAPYGLGAPLPEVSMEILGADLATEAELVTGDDGSFSTSITSYQDMYLILSREDLTTTVFSGAVACADASSTDGALWVAPSTANDELRSIFGDCAGSSEGGVIAGEVRQNGSSAVSELPFVTNANLTAYDSTGIPYEACYLDSKGLPAKDALAVGSMGVFAVFGLPAGPTTLLLICADVEIDGSVQCTAGAQLEIRVVMEEGALAPFFPLLL